MSKSVSRQAWSLGAACVVAGLCSMVPTLLQAQARDLSGVSIQSPLECGGLLAEVRGAESGSQWLIGDGIPVYAEGNDRSPLGLLNDSFEPVLCYEQVNLFGEADRVLVANPNGSVCGWVDRSSLLPTHLIGTDRNQRGSICSPPRAMPFEAFCDILEDVSGKDVDACVGLPGGLRAKGVVIGSSENGSMDEYPFMTSPQSGEIRSDQGFFSILELHDIAPGDDGTVMALAGDGEGEVFGWVDMRAIELWPTRLGLFYDSAGEGLMFQREGDLIGHWRSGAPDPDISSGLSGDDLEAYIHGGLQLLTYPIVRTVRPDLDPAAGRSDDVPYHEVIFFGQTGEGSVTELLALADQSRRAATLRRMNIVFLVDTTESMRPYLPSVRQGLAAYIADFDRLARDPANRIPETRVAVFSYSDFRDADSTGLDDPIVIERIMAPSRIGQFDLTARLNGIESHAGLDDEVGLFSEAAFESVAQLARTFSSDDIWHQEAVNVIIHIADHGSRPDISMPRIANRLRDLGVQYVPLIVQTDDGGQAARTTARRDLINQALDLFGRYIVNPTEADLATVVLRPGESAGSRAVRDQLNLVLGELLEATGRVRQSFAGSTNLTESQLVRDLASSRIRLDEAFLESAGLTDFDGSSFVRASTAFAPLSGRVGGLVAEIDWTYSVALEPRQTAFLRQSFQELCNRVGDVEQRSALRALIIDLAETFSGDEIETEAQFGGVMADLANMPGAEGSFLAQSSGQLLQLIDSTDPGVIDSLRQDVCWTSYHLSNVANNVYVRPEQLMWEGRAFVPQPGESVVARNYRDRPIIGPELDYLPNFFFVRPSRVAEGEVCGFFDDC